MFVYMSYPASNNKMNIAPAQWHPFGEIATEKHRDWPHRVFATFLLVIMFIPVMRLGHTLHDEHLCYGIYRGIQTAMSQDPAHALTLLFHDPLLTPHGRMFPFYPSFLAALFSITGRNDVARHTVSFVLFLLLTQLIFSWTRRLSAARYAPLVAVLLFLFGWTYRAMCVCYLQEPPITLLLFLGLWCFYNAERQDSPAWKSIFSAGLAGVCFVLAVGLKETAIAIFPCLLFLHASAWNTSSARVRRLNRGTIPLTLLAMLAYLLYFLSTPRSPGAYTTAYRLDSISGLLKNTILWHEVVTANYSLILYLGGGAFLLALGAALRQHTLSNGLRWRVGLAVFGCAFLVLIAPWERKIARLLMPGFFALNILFAVEIGEWWDRFQKSVTGGNAESSRASSSLTGSLVFGTAIWIAPIIMYPLHGGVLLFEFVLLVLFLFFAIRWYAEERKNFLRLGRISLSTAKTGRISIVTALAFYIGAGTLMTVTDYNMVSLLNTHRHKEGFEYVAKVVPMGGRLIINTAHSYAYEIRTHLADCLDRPDITVCKIDDLKGPIATGDTILSFHLPAFSENELIARLGAGQRERKVFQHRILLFNGYFIQPGRLTLWLLGLSAPETYFFNWLNWNALYGWKECPMLVFAPAEEAPS